MAATAGLSLTLDTMGKMFQNASSLKPLGQLFQYFPIWSCVITMICDGSHLGFWNGIENPNLLEDLQMIISGQ
jgi:hypothetical protein